MRQAPGGGHQEPTTWIQLLTNKYHIIHGLKGQRHEIFVFFTSKFFKYSSCWDLDLQRPFKVQIIVQYSNIPTPA